MRTIIPFEKPVDFDEELHKCNQKIMLAEQRLGYLEKMLRNVMADKRMKTRQKMLARSVNQQHHEVMKLRETARKLLVRSKTRATRYVKRESKTAKRSNR